MDKNAIFVIGPEASGTKNMGRLVESAGFANSDDVLWAEDYTIRWKDALNWDNIVIRFSLPFNKQWVPLDIIMDKLSSSGYAISCLVTMRDWHCMSHSQVNSGHVETIEQAKDQISLAYAYIFSKILINARTVRPRCRHMTISYESLIHKPKETLQTIEDELGLEFPTDAWQTIIDGNQKYYDMKR